MKVPFQIDPYSVMAVSPVSPFWDAATVCFFFRSNVAFSSKNHQTNTHTFNQIVFEFNHEREFLLVVLLKKQWLIQFFKFKIFMFYQHEGPSTIPKITRNLLQPSPVMVAFRHETWIHQALQDGAQLCKLLYVPPIYCNYININTT